MKPKHKHIIIALISPLALFILLAVAIYLPPVQNFLVHRAAEYISSQTGMHVEVRHVRLLFPLDLGVDGVRITQESATLPLRQDTLADIWRIRADVELLPLLRSEVCVNAFELQQAKINTLNIISTAQIKGYIRSLKVVARGVDLKESLVNVNDLAIERARVSVFLNDTAKEDTTSTPTRWRILAQKASIKDSRISLHTAGDTLTVAAQLGDVALRNGDFDLFRNAYSLKRLYIANSRVAYDNRFKQPQSGLDWNHILLSDIALWLKDISYRSGCLALNVERLCGKERCGITIDSLSTVVALDSARLRVNDFRLTTRESSARLSLLMDLDAFSDNAPGTMRLSGNMSLGRQDLKCALGSSIAGGLKYLPQERVLLNAVVQGNMRNMQIGGLNVTIPTILTLNAKGRACHLDNMKSLTADASFSMKTLKSNRLIASILKANGVEGVNVPDGLTLSGNFKTKALQLFDADIRATEGGGRLTLNGSFNAKSRAYQARIDAKDFHTSHFISSVPLGDVSLKADLQGAGYDIMSQKTSITAALDIDKMRLMGHNADNVKANISLRNSILTGRILSHNDLLDGQVAASMQRSNGFLKGDVDCDIDRIDLKALNIAKENLVSRLRLQAQVATNGKETHFLRGYIKDVIIQDDKRTYQPKDIDMSIFCKRDSTFARVKSNDFNLHLVASDGYKGLLKRINGISQETAKQVEAKRIDQMALRKWLPEATLTLKSGTENLFSKYLKQFGLGFQTADVDLRSSPVEGLNGHLDLTEVRRDSLLLDTVRVKLHSDSTQFFFSGQVRNNEHNPKRTFNGLFDGYLLERGAGLNASLYDEENRLSTRLGLEAEVKDNGINLHLNPNGTVLGYQNFLVNADNYVYMAADHRISAKLNVLNDDGTGVRVYSNDDNQEALQDLTVSLDKFNLKKILSVVPYAPNITGILDGDFHAIKTGQSLSVASSVAVRELVYEGCPMGDISTDFVYMPKQDGSHYVDCILMQNDNEVCTLTGTYFTDKGFLEADVEMARTPLNLLNGFMPEHIVGFKGYASGRMKVKGTLNDLQMNGEILPDSAYLFSQPYGVDMRMAEDALRIVGSNIVFEDYKMFAHNDNPLRINGNVDCQNLSDISMSLSLKADNFQAINAKENAGSISFGKAFVNLIGSISGHLDNLRMRGKVDLLASTDMSYILRDTPLSNDNQWEGLVRFTSLSDSTKQTVKRAQVSGFDMDMTVAVMNGARVMCYLNTDHSNYLDIMGGGTLRMLYNAQGGFRLTGRYTFSSGEMKYSLPVIPLKTFNIQDGSYIEFQGEAMNPKLNITATEKLKASVANEGTAGRTVEFDCGVKITKTLDDMGLEFVIDTDEDMSVSNSLKAMSLEQRGKVAVTMLTTGMYITDGNTSGFTMNSALSSFLESEINNITGNALRTLDFSFGLDNTTDRSGNLHTDYSFRFAKRFWNNRLKIVVGSKVSSGERNDDENQSFFDNVSMEYRLDNTANKYLRLFYDNNAYDWLEGNTRKAGVGFVWKRNLQHFKDLFRFKPQDTKADTLKGKKPLLNYKTSFTEDTTTTLRQ